MRFATTGMMSMDITVSSIDLAFSVSISLPFLYYSSLFFAFYTEYHLGEVLDGRYKITAGYGKGVFSTVVQAKDLKAGKNDPEEVAIKIICNDDTKER